MGKNLLKAVVFSTLLLSGCDSCKQKPVDTKNLTINNLEKAPEMVDYFATISDVDWDSGISLVTGDFNNDGNLDLIIGTVYNSTTSMRTQFYEGDGKGNFKLRQYPVKK